MNCHLRRIGYFLSIIIAAAVVPSAYALPITVSMPLVKYDQSMIGQTITLPITVSDVTGLGFVAYKFTLVYDRTIIQYEGYDADRTITSGFAQVGIDHKNDTLMWSAAGIYPMAGQGTLVNLQFKILSAATTPLKFPVFKFNARIDASVTDGRVKIGNTKPVISPAAQVDAFENETIQMTVSGTDADRDTLSYSMTGAPSGAVLNAKTGGFTWVVPSGSNGNYSIQFSCTDEAGAVDSTKWTLGILLTHVNHIESVLPADCILLENYPNPFNPATTIKFGLPVTLPVTLEVYSVLGGKVRTLLNGSKLEAAYHTVVWDGKSDAGTQVASGMYLLRLAAGKYSSAIKMLLMK